MVELYNFKTELEHEQSLVLHFYIFENSALGVRFWWADHLFDLGGLNKNQH